MTILIVGDFLWICMICFIQKHIFFRSTTSHTPKSVGLKKFIWKCANLTNSPWRKNRYEFPWQCVGNICHIMSVQWPYIYTTGAIFSRSHKKINILQDNKLLWICTVYFRWKCMIFRSITKPKLQWVYCTKTCICDQNITRSHEKMQVFYDLAISYVFVHFFSYKKSMILCSKTYEWDINLWPRNNYELPWQCYITSVQ